MLKKLWIAFLSFLPFGAAGGPFLVALGVGAVSIAGFAIYRSNNPVDVAQAYEFFSSCWSCQMFSDLMSTMSEILPRVYNGLGGVIVPFAIGVTAIWIAWQVIKSFTNNLEKIDGWSLSDTFVTHFVKLVVVSVVLLAPLPRMMTDYIIEPVFNVGLYVNRVVAGDEKFNACLVATALSDQVTAHQETATSGAFTPKFRHNLACQVANVHQLTGIGMTAGWTLMNMAFNDEYMHKILWRVPILPNVPMFLGGALLIILFLGALLPIPIYFIEVFVKLSMDLILLPLTFLGWLFKGWNIFPQGSQNKNLRAIVDDIITATVGIAMTCLFVTFAVFFLGTLFGESEGVLNLELALANGDSKMLIDGLLLQNESLVTIVIVGLFIAMFMISIPALVKSLFKVSISTEYYDSIKKDLKTVTGGIKKIWQNAKK